MPDVENAEAPDLEKEDVAIAEEFQSGEPGDTTKLDQDGKAKDNKSGRHTEKNNGNNTRRKKIIRALKWAGIVLFPLISAAIFFWTQPPSTQDISNDSKQARKPETATKQWPAQEQEMVDFINLTLTETEQVWKKIFIEKDSTYRKPELTLFTNKIESACNHEQIASGSFYCPQEQQIYIDLSLYLDLKNRLDIPGDFAQGYIVAHEIGHHVQNLAGIYEQVPEARLLLTDKEFKMVSLRLELQADCFAGIWAKHTDKQYHSVEREDIIDALHAVNRISHERLRQQTEEEITPDALTHGSSRQRIRWFMIGYNRGSFDACDTFTTTDL